MASLKQSLGTLVVGQLLPNFHDRKVMASLKRIGDGDHEQRDLDFHDRKVMASLKLVLAGRLGLGLYISMIERSWPH